MKQFRRFAIYFAPRDGALLDAIEHWLGRSARAGITVTALELPALAGGDSDLSALTADPRRYGCHATLKAPFRLAPTQTLPALRQALSDYSAQRAPITLEGLNISQIGSFVALTPRGEITALQAFAFDIVQNFNHFGAALSPAEIARRRPDRLSPRQRDLLELWSYPYVAEEFRFHITLSGTLTPLQAAVILPEITARIGPSLPSPFIIEDLCLFGEAESGDFELIERFELLS